MNLIYQLSKRNSLKVLGLMSGTSMDGLDICYSEIRNLSGNIEPHLIAFSSYEYSSDFKSFLEETINGRTEEICHANFKITREWVGFIENFVIENDINESEIDLIGSHGQTVWHIHNDSTLQIGESSVLAERFRVPVVSDYRVRDVAAGGSGAPLVPYVDYLLFKDYGKTFLVLNIGGIANFTIVPKNVESVEEIYALDTGPGNVLIDATVSILTEGNQKFDRDGEFAKKGRVRDIILKDLMNHPYIVSSPPKSTGREIFGHSFVNSIINRYGIKTQEDFYDLIATFTRYTTAAIHFNYEKFFGGKYPIEEIVISGGGANNPAIMWHLKDLFKSIKISSSDRYGVIGDAKEAFAFSIFAALAIWEIPGNVPNATGAKHPVVLGKVTL